MNMYKSYQFRLYPSDSQIIQIQKTFGCTRLVYNYYLEKRKKEHLTCFDMIKDLPNLYSEYPFLKEVDSCSLRCSLFDLEDGIKRFINHQNNYPKFKGKYSSKRSYRTNCITSTYKERKYENIKVDLKRKVITLPKLKEVKIKGYRNLESLPGRIINATISEYSSGMLVY
jgi:putative transposase